ncbi:ribonuclease HIII [Mesomycoplasma neurolyticum]|uniref:Ribonuclease n=1 Tax=Mesomycoplasma neurolyticum TaxID=2120 RepID=A0A449A6G0_9BACT|nr:ribonuclease HIII [Mesomycoplasma neurolyticum]VEU59818.1 ribonuclease HII [Mesomycoplasma neurolyticum]
MISNIDINNIIGCDETGVGDYFSPIVFSCVWIDKTQKHKLENIGITDSKKLTKNKIQELSTIIKENCLSITISINQDVYNRMITEKWNANEIKMIAYLEAFEKFFSVNHELISNLKPTILVDQFSTIKSIEKYIKKIIDNKIVPLNYFNDFSLLNFETKAEIKYLSVACASILARQTLNMLMDKQNKKWNMIFPYGAWNDLILNFTKKFVAKHGKKSLNYVAKVHFKNTKKI